MWYDFSSFRRHCTIRIERIAETDLDTVRLRTAALQRRKCRMTRHLTVVEAGAPEWLPVPTTSTPAARLQATTTWNEKYSGFSISSLGRHTRRLPILNSIWRFTVLLNFLYLRNITYLNAYATQSTPPFLLFIYVYIGLLFIIFCVSFYFYWRCICHDRGLLLKQL